VNISGGTRRRTSEMMSALKTHNEYLFAHDLTPYGEVLESAGSGSSAYGYTGEWMDSSGLVYLRARYYSPVQGRFMTRDTWGGNQGQPMSYNAWLYGYANPIKYVDPTGRYHKSVHLDLTRDRVVYWYRYYPLPGVNREQLANLIAEWDYRVDTSPYLISIGVCGECHFKSLDETITHVNTAVSSSQPYLFGGSLHQLQDYYAHWREGYHNQFWGHGYHSVVAGNRNQFFLDDFFEGGHVDDFGFWTPSPFSAHPREKVIQEIRNKNPEINLIGLFDWDLVDLYLRLDPTDPNSQQRFDERDYFGFQADFTVMTSKRERMMQISTDSYIKEFLKKLADEPCPNGWINWTYPSNADMEIEIRKLLTE
jgi:RHS repeat-associated protein